MQKHFQAHKFVRIRNQINQKFIIKDKRAGRLRKWLYQRLYRCILIAHNAGNQKRKNAQF